MEEVPLIDQSSLTSSKTADQITTIINRFSVAIIEIQTSFKSANRSHRPGPFPEPIRKLDLVQICRTSRRPLNLQSTLWWHAAGTASACSTSCIWKIIVFGSKSPLPENLRSCHSLPVNPCVKLLNVAPLD